MHGDLCMLAVKPGKRDEVINVTMEFLSLSSKFSGFVDFIGLVADTSQDDVAGLWLFTNKSDADAFRATPEFKKFLEQLMPLLERIDVYGYQVGHTNFYKVAKGKAV